VIISQAAVQILSSEKGISPTKQRIEAATAEGQGLVSASYTVTS
jgi:hypothetical protein